MSEIEEEILKVCETEEEIDSFLLYDKESDRQKGSD